MTTSPRSGAIATAPSSALAPATILAFETAGSNCSAVVARGGVVLAEERRPLRHGHGEMLLPMIERVTIASGLPRREIDTVAVAVGPGGFTGIRVGLAAASGIALALGARLVGVSSFEAVVAGVIERDDGVGRGSLLVALDSRRADFYVQLFALDHAARCAAALAAPQAVLPDRLTEYLAGYLAEVGGGAPLLIAGDAADAAAAALEPGAALRVAHHSAPDALGVAAAARQRLHAADAGEPVRPVYLRPPDVTLPARRRPLPAAAP